MRRQSVRPTNTFLPLSPGRFMSAENWELGLDQLGEEWGRWESPEGAVVSSLS